MTGLEKMIRQIEEEAENTAASIIREAEEEAAALCREAEQSCARIRKEAEEEGQARAEEILRKACSGAGMEDRKRELQLKQELLCETMERALRMLQELEGPTARFDACLAPHAHIRCTCCGRVMDLSALEEPAPVRSAAEAGWQVERYSLMLEGICPACAGKDHNEF